MSINQSAPKVIELFAGVGGFRLGLEAAGWKTVWSNQWEPATKAQHASSCYVANFGPEGHSNEDIAVAIDLHESGKREIPDADLIVGGFPCQDYSVAKSASSSHGLQGKKGVLWWQIHRLVSHLKPKLVFLENVDRLLKSPSSQRGRDFAVMLRTLGDLGYAVEWRVVNAADYGFPQRRIRVFLVATRIDMATGQGWSREDYFSHGVLPSAFPAVSYSPVESFQLEKNPDEISTGFNVAGSKSPFLDAGLYFNGNVLTSKPEVKAKEIATLGSVLVEDNLVPAEYWISDDKVKDWEFLKGAKSIARVSKSGHTYNYAEGKMAFPDSVDKPSRTILTGEGGSTPSRFKHVIRTASGLRRLTPLELERLSGFPDDWTRFAADKSELTDARRAFFIGNALVVGLITKVGEELKRRYF
jgi:DNA (cytosine-5)-methyltransferase 1